MEEEHDPASFQLIDNTKWPPLERTPISHSSEYYTKNLRTLESFLIINSGCSHCGSSVFSKNTTDYNIILRPKFGCRPSFDRSFRATCYSSIFIVPFFYFLPLWASTFRRDFIWDWRKQMATWSRRHISIRRRYTVDSHEQSTETWCPYFSYRRRCLETKHGNVPYWRGNYRQSGFRIIVDSHSKRAPTSQPWWAENNIRQTGGNYHRTYVVDQHSSTGWITSSGWHHICSLPCLPNSRACTSENAYFEWRYQQLYTSLGPFATFSWLHANLWRNLSWLEPRCRNWCQHSSANLQWIYQLWINRGHCRRRFILIWCTQFRLLDSS